MNYLRKKIHGTLFRQDTPSGRMFEVILITLVLLSVLLDMLETVETLYDKYANVFEIAELFFTTFFSIEFVLRLYSATKWNKYLFSFYGIIDCISVVPLYLISFFPTFRSITILRSFRVLRIFRIFKVGAYTDASKSLFEGLVGTKAKIIVFLLTTVTVVIFMGTLMYLIEGKENGFNSIPQSIYWAVVTLTTVGYGDIVPHTVFGKTVSAILMVIGYGIIAVPTGLVSADMVSKQINDSMNEKNDDNKQLSEKSRYNYCPQCGCKLDNDKNNNLIS